MYTQAHAQHAKLGGSGGMHAPPGKFLKTDALKWHLEATLHTKSLSPLC